jgi:hypothetical protein
MKMIPKVLGGLCILWVLLGMTESYLKYQSSDLLKFWGNGAIKAANEVLQHSGDPRMLDGTPLTVSRQTLIMLTLRAEQPTDEALYRLVSVGFALMAGISFLFLSRRQTHDTPQSA